MRSLGGLVLAVALLVPAAPFAAQSAPAATSPAAPDVPARPPRLVGVWYGEYSVELAGATRRAEMWLEISSQADTDGWEVGGHDRWNVLDHPEETIAGATARSFESFDSVSGRIDPDGRRVTLTEGTRKSRIEATLVADDTLQAAFEPADGSPGFTVTLRRIDPGIEPSDVAVLGIDVSHHSGKVDWQAVRARGYRFAYVKASEGVDDADPMFATHWQALREAGMPRGAYHFYVTEDDPQAQARFFASRLGDDPGTLPPAVDVELLGHGTTGDLTATLLVFLRTLEAALGVRPIVYTASGFWDSSYSPEFSAYPLWMAEYGVDLPRVPFGWTSWLFWQRQADQAVDGVENTADVNLLHPGVDLATLRAKE